MISSCTKHSDHVVVVFEREPWETESCLLCEANTRITELLGKIGALEKEKLEAERALCQIDEENSRLKGELQQWIENT